MKSLFMFVRAPHVVSKWPPAFVSIHTRVGQFVYSNYDVLASIDADKMVFDIHAPEDGLIKTIFVQEGQEVFENDVLFEMEIKQ